MDPDSVGVALGTTAGVVKRVVPDHLSNRDSWEIIGLKDGDEVIGAVELTTGDEELCFVTSPTRNCCTSRRSAVRPQGRTAGGMAGVRLAAKAKVVFFGAVDTEREAQVVTIAGSSSALPGTEVGAVKVTPFSEYPGKGRGTGGVRCQRLLKGEDGLLLGVHRHGAGEGQREQRRPGRPATCRPAARRFRRTGGSAHRCMRSRSGRLTP